MSIESNYDVSVDYNVLVSSIGSIKDIQGKCSNLISDLSAVDVSILDTAGLMAASINIVESFISGPVQTVLSRVSEVEALFNMFQSQEFYTQYLNANGEFDMEKMITDILSSVETQESCFTMVEKYDLVLAMYDVKLREIQEQIDFYERQESLGFFSSVDFLVSKRDTNLSEDSKKKLEELEAQYSSIYQATSLVNTLRNYAMDAAFFMYGSYDDFTALSSIPTRIAKYEAKNITDFNFYDASGNLIEVSDAEAAVYFANIGKNYSFGELGDLSHTYSYLTEEEKNVANYLVNTGNVQKLQQYFAFKEDYANMRHGEELAKEVTSKIDSYYVGADTSAERALAYTRTLSLLATDGFSDGLSNFVDGISNLFTADGVVSAEQYKTSFLVDYLSNRYDDSQWSEIIATGAYEISTSLGNMAPSMALGFLTGCPLFGSASMGLSAVGSSREQGLQSGMNEVQAWIYGSLSGASEMTLEYFVGAIPGLSKLDDVAKLPGFKGFLAKMGSEAMEESTQSLAEPLFNTMVTGQKYEVDMKEVLKSGIYGAITAGVTNGGQMVIGKIIYSMKNMDSKFLADLALKYETEDLTDSSTQQKLHSDLAKYRVDSDKSATTVSNDTSYELVESVESQKNNHRSTNSSPKLNINQQTNSEQGSTLGSGSKLGNNSTSTTHATITTNNGLQTNGSLVGSESTAYETLDDSIPNSGASNNESSSTSAKTDGIKTTGLETISYNVVGSESTTYETLDDSSHNKDKTSGNETNLGAVSLGVSALGIPTLGTAIATLGSNIATDTSSSGKLYSDERIVINDDSRSAYENRENTSNREVSQDRLLQEIDEGEYELQDGERLNIGMQFFANKKSDSSIEMVIKSDIEFLSQAKIKVDLNNNWFSDNGVSEVNRVKNILSNQLVFEAIATNRYGNYAQWLKYFNSDILNNPENIKLIALHNIDYITCVSSENLSNIILMRECAAQDGISPLILDFVGDNVRHDSEFIANLVNNCSDSVRLSELVEYYGIDLDVTSQYSNESVDSSIVFENTQQAKADSSRTVLVDNGISNFFRSDFTSAILPLKSYFERVGSSHFMHDIQGLVDYSLRYAVLFSDSADFSGVDFSQFVNEFLSFANIERANFKGFDRLRGEETLIYDFLKKKLLIKFNLTEDNLSDINVRKQLVDYISKRRFKGNYKFHAFSSISYDGIRERGISPSVNNISQQDVDRMISIFNKYSSSNNMLFGYRKLNSEGTVFYSEIPSVSYNYALSAPEWFASFTEKLDNRGQHSFVERNYKQAKQNLLDKMERDNFSANDKSEVLDFFDKYWNLYTEGKPMLAIIPETNTEIREISAKMFDRFASTKDYDIDVILMCALDEGEIDGRSNSTIDVSNAIFVELPVFKDIVDTLSGNVVSETDAGYELEDGARPKIGLQFFANPKTNSDTDVIQMFNEHSNDQSKLHDLFSNLSVSEYVSVYNKYFSNGFDSEYLLELLENPFEGDVSNEYISKVLGAIYSIGEPEAIDFANDLINELGTEKINEMIADGTLTYNSELAPLIKKHIYKVINEGRDVLFGKMDGQYGVDQNAIGRNIKYTIGKTWVADVRDFANFIKEQRKCSGASAYVNAVYLNTPLAEISSSDRKLIIRYLATKENNGGIRGLLDFERDVLKRKTNDQFNQFHRKFSVKCVDSVTATKILECINTTGVCSYASFANVIVNSYIDNPSGFKNDFGFDLFIEVDGKRQINSQELLTDMYIFMNSVENGGRLFKTVDGKITLVGKTINTKNQRYVSKRTTYNDLAFRYLESKNPKLAIKSSEVIDATNMSESDLKDAIAKALQAGYQLDMYVGRDLEHVIPFNNKLLIEQSTDTWDEGDAHSVFVTGMTDTSLIVSSWGKRYTIPFESLANNPEAAFIVCKLENMSTNVSSIELVKETTAPVKSDRFSMDLEPELKTVNDADNLSDNSEEVFAKPKSNSGDIVDGQLFEDDRYITTKISVGKENIFVRISSKIENIILDASFRKLDVKISKANTPRAVSDMIRAVNESSNDCLLRFDSKELISLLEHGYVIDKNTPGILCDAIVKKLLTAVDDKHVSPAKIYRAMELCGLDISSEYIMDFRKNIVSDSILLNKLELSDSPKLLLHDILEYSSDVDIVNSALNYFEFSGLSDYGKENVLLVLGKSDFVNNIPIDYIISIINNPNSSVEIISRALNHRAIDASVISSDNLEAVMRRFETADNHEFEITERTAPIFVEYVINNSNSVDLITNVVNNCNHQVLNADLIRTAISKGYIITDTSSSKVIEHILNNPIEYSKNLIDAFEYCSPELLTDDVLAKNFDLSDDYISIPFDEINNLSSVRRIADYVVNYYINNSCELYSPQFDLVVEAIPYCDPVLFSNFDVSRAAEIYIRMNSFDLPSSILISYAKHCNSQVFDQSIIKYMIENNSFTNLELTELCDALRQRGYHLDVESPVEIFEPIVISSVLNSVVNFNDSYKNLLYDVINKIGTAPLYFEGYNGLFREDVLKTFGVDAICEIYKYCSLVGNEFNFESLTESDLQNLKTIYDISFNTVDTGKVDIRDFISLVTKYKENLSLFNQLLSNNLDSDVLKNLRKFVRCKFDIKISSVEELINFEHLVKDYVSDVIERGDPGEIRNVSAIILFNETSSYMDDFFSRMADSDRIEALMVRITDSKVSDVIKRYSDLFDFYKTNFDLTSDPLKMQDALRKINDLSYSEYIGTEYDLDRFFKYCYGLELDINLTKLSEINGVDGINKRFVNKFDGYVYPKDGSGPPKQVGVDYIEIDSSYKLLQHALNSYQKMGSVADLSNPKLIGRSYLSLSLIGDGKSGIVRDASDLDIDHVVALYDHLEPSDLLLMGDNDLGSYADAANDLDVKVFRDRTDRLKFDVSDKILERTLTDSHNEYVLYRDHAKPAGILVTGDIPSKAEIDAAATLGVPLVKINKSDTDYTARTVGEHVVKNEEIARLLESSKKMANVDANGSGPRKIAIITDAHGLFRPTLTALQDARNQGVSEIYSLGDNIGFGPNSSEVLQLLENYGVVSVMGNHEQYVSGGVEQFESHFGNRASYEDAIRSNELLRKMLTEKQVKGLETSSQFIELILGGKKLLLVHSVKDYNTHRMVVDPSKYDLIIQGHVHFENSGDGNIRTARGLGIGGRPGTASYIVLEELTNGSGYKLEVREIEYDIEKQKADIAASELDSRSKKRITNWISADANSGFHNTQIHYDAKNNQAVNGEQDNFTKGQGVQHTLENAQAVSKSADFESEEVAGINVDASTQKNVGTDDNLHQKSEVYDSISNDSARKGILGISKNSMIEMKLAGASSRTIDGMIRAGKLTDYLNTLTFSEIYDGPLARHVYQFANKMDFDAMGDSFVLLTREQVVQVDSFMNSINDDLSQGFALSQESVDMMQDMSSEELVVVIDKLLSDSNYFESARQVVKFINDSVLGEVVDRIMVRSDSTVIISYLDAKQVVTLMNYYSEDSISFDKFCRNVSYAKFSKVAKVLNEQASRGDLNASRLRNKLDRCIDSRFVSDIRIKAKNGTLNSYLNSLSDSKLGQLFEKLIEQKMSDGITMCDSMIEMIGKNRFDSMVRKGDIKFDIRFSSKTKRAILDIVNQQKDGSLKELSVYGVDQGYIRSHIRYVVKYNWSDDVSDISKFLSKNYGLGMFEAESMALNLTSPTYSFDYDDYKMAVDYLEFKYGKIEAVRMASKIFGRKVDNRYMAALNKLVSYGTDIKTAQAILDCIDTTGVCSYASVANLIVDVYKNNPSQFKADFGFDLYTYENGRKEINSTELLADMYIYINSNLCGGRLFTITNGRVTTNTSTINTENQVFLSSSAGFRSDLVNKYLHSKNPNVSVNVTSASQFYADGINSEVDNIKTAIVRAIQEGKQVTLGVYRTKGSEYKFLDENGIKRESTIDWSEGDGHAVYVTGVTDNGVVVSTWGMRRVIPFTDFIDNQYRINFVEMAIDGSVRANSTRGVDIYSNPDTVIHDGKAVVMDGVSKQDNYSSNDDYIDIIDNLIKNCSDIEMKYKLKEFVRTKDVSIFSQEYQSQILDIGYENIRDYVRYELFHEARKVWLSFDPHESVASGGKFICIISANQSLMIPVSSDENDVEFVSGKTILMDDLNFLLSGKYCASSEDILGNLVSRGNIVFELNFEDKYTNLNIPNKISRKLFDRFKEFNLEQLRPLMNQFLLQGGEEYNICGGEYTPDSISIDNSINVEAGIGFSDDSLGQIETLIDDSLVVVEEYDLRLEELKIRDVTIEKPKYAIIDFLKSMGKSNAVEEISVGDSHIKRIGGYLLFDVMGDAVTQLEDYFGDFGLSLASELLCGETIESMRGKLSDEQIVKFDKFLTETEVGKFIVKVEEKGLISPIIEFMQGGDDSFKAINDPLYDMGRNGDIDDVSDTLELPNGKKVKELIGNLDSAIELFGGLRDNMVLYKWVTLGSFMGQNNSGYKELFRSIDKYGSHPDVQAYLIYKIFKKQLENRGSLPYFSAGFMSTSPRFDINWMNKTNIVLQILAPAGTPGAYINQLSPKFYNQENEFLLARKRDLKIVDVSLVNCDGRIDVILKGMLV